ncbi:hypothetical protein SAMN06297422_107114 [Lachnospiraceae bacterium]|nr:hypothetical protein SAMN06297422_107114 [Lachnospiraceae bacterium]
MKKGFKKLFAMLLAMALIIGAFPGGGAAKVKAAGTVVAVYDSSTGKVTISWSKDNARANYYKVYVQVNSGSWADKSASTIYSGSNTSYSYNAAYDSAGTYRIRIDEFASSASASVLTTQYSNEYVIGSASVTATPTNFKVVANTNGGYTISCDLSTDGYATLIEASKDGKTFVDFDKLYDRDIYDYAVSRYKDKLNSTVGDTNYFRACYVTSDGTKGPYTDVVSCKYENFEEMRAKLIEEAEKIKNTPATITYEGGYDVTKPLAAGMKKIFDHPAYHVAIECINYNNSYAFKYTLTTKMDGGYLISVDANGRYDDQDDDWKDANGNSVAFAKERVQAKKGEVYTLITPQAYTRSTTGHNTTEMNIDLVNNDIYFDAAFLTSTFDFSVAPSLGTLEVTKADTKSITLVPGIETSAVSTKISYKKKSDKTWKTTTASSNGTTIKGLKASTEYQYKWTKTCRASYKDDSGKEVTYTLTSKESAVKTVKTGLSTKPTVKSVKISKAVHKRTWVPAQWRDTKLIHKGYWNDRTTFTLTIKLKKKVKGAKGYIVQVGNNDPVYVKGNKTTIKFQTSIKGNQVGNKTKIKVSTYSNADKTGTGAYSKAKSSKIKK